MHAYYAKESPISPPFIMPPSQMLSPMFNPQELFCPEELFPPKKQRHDRSSSFTSALPQEFKIGESFCNTALEAQVANMANSDNTNRNLEPREVPVARKCSYKEFMSCQPFNFKGSEGAVRLIRWFERTESVFSRSNCIEDYKVKSATDSEKMMEAFIRGLPRSIKGNFTAFKPQTLEEAINIAQRLLDQDLALSSVRHATGWVIRRGTTKTKDYPLEAISNQYWGCQVFIAQVLEKKSEDKQLEDTPVVREFPDVFLEDLSGLPPVRQVEFQIDLIPRATPVARAPYRLAPLEMQEISNQLQELADRGFI
nr:putative reverse transcriptase domain-containing protein [Tanacetum cinerariifolium]